MRTAPIHERIIEQLQEHYREILKLKQQADPESVVNQQVFIRLHQQISRHEWDALPAHDYLEHTFEQLNKLREYLYQFEAFRRMSLSFFKEAKKIPVAEAKKNVHYTAAKQFFKQIYEDFKAGRFIQSGMYASIQQMEKHTKAFHHFIAKSKQEQPPEMVIFEPIHRQEEEEDAPTLVEFVQGKLSTTPDIPKTRLEQITKGYFVLKAKELSLFTNGENFKLSKRLEFLKKGLTEGETQKILTAVRLLSQMVAPTRITSPTNYITTSKKLIQITGTTEPGTDIIIILNEKVQQETLAKDDGSFVFPLLELEFGKNTIEYYNNELFFLNQQRGYLHITLDAKLPFLGMHDPLTQKAFQESEATIIRRCSTCQSFMYDFSIEENNDECAVPKCDGRDFYEMDDTEFWL